MLNRRKYYANLFAIFRAVVTLQPSAKLARAGEIRMKNYVSHFVFHSVYTIFVARNDKNTIVIMSTAQLTAELFRQMSLIVEDEGKLKRALKALKRITASKPDPTLMSEEEYMALLDKSEEEFRNGKYKSFSSVKDLDRYIRSL